jgi:hypothetical protein
MAFCTQSFRQQLDDLQFPCGQFQHDSLPEERLAAHNRAFTGCSMGKMSGGSGQNTQFYLFKGDAWSKRSAARFAVADAAPRMKQGD